VKISATTLQSHSFVPWLLACALWVAGCGSPPPPPPKPTTLNGNIVASPALNQDARNRASPVVVRMYELKSSALFEAADFVSLYDKDQATLGAEMIGRDEVVVRPGETQAIAVKTLPADAKFIGVMAAYRELERARWRVLVPVAPNKVNLLTIQLDELAVQASVSAR
jgi:type VI secretion system protein VasD